MTKLKLLFAQKTRKFDEICALVARELGYGKLPTLKNEDRDQVEAEAQEYIKLWEETVEMLQASMGKPVRASRIQPIRNWTGRVIAYAIWKEK